jgi:putative glutamine amidotransferase
MRPLIAVIGRRASSVSSLRFAGTAAAAAICEAVLAAGGEPLVLYGGGDHLGELPQRLDSFSGVLLPGGSDINPRRYGQIAVPETDEPDPEQDDIDFLVARTVLRNRLPTLAICRGMQVVNIACGGTLTQHLLETGTHHGNAVHEVTTVTGSRLRSLTADASFRVSSYHHQAVDRLGDNLLVTAAARDGCIEAIEHRFADIVGVQWHPEDRCREHPEDQALFDDLVERARIHAAGVQSLTASGRRGQEAIR